MVRVDNVEVFNFAGAIRGCRAPYRSYDKSDSGWRENDLGYQYYRIGEADMALMQKLYKGGPEHRKFMRQIFVTMDITAPLYWWKQFDKYQIGVTTDSESTMHTLAKEPLSILDFSFDTGDSPLIDDVSVMSDIMHNVVDCCEYVRKKYQETKDPALWRLLIQLLPESYNQTRVVTMNYEVAATIIRQRSGHKLCEWRVFIEELRDLPYLSEIMGEEE